MKAMIAMKWEVTRTKREIKVIYLNAYIIIININLSDNLYLIVHVNLRVCVLTCCGSRGPYTGSPGD